MITSQEKLGDIKARLECLQIIKYSLMHGHLDIAKEIGAMSVRYAEKIKGDYTQRDKQWATYYKALSIPLKLHV